jgi:hypothetical protein
MRTLTELKSIMNERMAKKHDHMVTVNAIQTNDGESFTFYDEPSMSWINTIPTHTAKRQMLTRLGYGKNTDFVWNTMTAEERKTVFNRLLSETGDNAMLRCTGSHLYGVVSDKYKIMDHDVALDIVESSGMNLALAKGSTIGNPDQGKFRFLPAEYAAKGYMRGGHIPMIEINNSENGLKSLQIFAGIFTVICSNGLIVPVRGTKTVKTRYFHKGNNEIEYPDLAIVFNQAETYVDKLIAAESKVVNINQKIRFANRMADDGLFTQEMVNRVIETANEHYRGGNTLANVVGSITQAAQSFKGVEIGKRTQMEEFAGRLLLAA